MSSIHSLQSRLKSFGLKLPDVDNPKYKIYSTAAIYDKEIIKLAEEVREILEDVSLDDCVTLLHDFKWNADGLLERFSEAESFDEFLKKNKIDLSVPLPPETLIDSFIHARSSSFKCCPNKIIGCEKVVKIDDPDDQEITCDCGLSFCFKCDAPPHSPFPCALLQEWIVQQFEIERILKEHNTICPHCGEVYQLDIDYDFPLDCISCDKLFMMLDNELKPSAFPESVLYDQIWENFEKIQEMIEELTEINAPFFKAAYKIIEDLLQKSLPLPAFSFFLDKEYLKKQSSTALLSIEMFEDFFEKFKPLIRDILKDKRLSTESYDSFITPYKQDMILNNLRLIQTYLDNLYARIENYDGWIFKLPEIQQNFYDSHDDDEMEVDDVDF